MTKETVLSVRKLKTKYKVETTNNQYSFSEETIIKYSIFKGKIIDRAEFELIQAEEIRNNLMNKAINYLSYQARSINEVRRYLNDRDCSYELADEIIEKIKNLGYLDDEVLANSLYDYVVRSKKGPKILEEKLISKGVDEDIIRVTINNYTNVVEEEVLDNLLENILNRYKSYPKKKQKNLIYQKLLRDGFSSDVIGSKLNKTKFIDESNQELEKDLKKLLNKYDQLDYKIRSKIISKLINKGYEYPNIIECLENIE